MDIVDFISNDAGNNVRKELIDYYKWIVNLATFVLTLSLSLAAFFPTRIHHTTLLGVGWLLLGLCIFFNWLLIKGLVTLPIALSTPEEERGILYAIYTRSIRRNYKRYGLLQNWLFLLGSLAVSLSFIWELFRT